MKRIVTTLSQKWPEYILEILVITIGILGAFALNNWNEQRKEKQIKAELIDQLITNYEANLLQLNQKIKMHETLVEAGFSLLSYFDSKIEADTSAILKYLSYLSIDPTFDPTTNDLQLSSKMNLITNPELKLLLTNWSSDLAALREIELMYQNQVYNHFITHLARIGIYREVGSYHWDNDEFNNEWLLGRERTLRKKIDRSSRVVDMQAVLSDRTLEGFIALAVDLNQSALEQAYVVQDKVMTIISLLKEERS